MSPHLDDDVTIQYHVVSDASDVTGVMTSDHETKRCHSVWYHQISRLSVMSAHVLVTSLYKEHVTTTQGVYSPTFACFSVSNRFALVPIVSLLAVVTVSTSTVVPTFQTNPSTATSRQ